MVWAFKLRQKLARGCLAVLTATAMGLSSLPGHADLLERVRAGETIEIALNNARPYAYLDEHGDLTGQEPAILRHILSQIGEPNDLKPRLMEFNAMINGLRSRRFDILAAGIYITPERCSEVAFSEPNVQSPFAFVVRAGNPKNITNFKTIRRNPELHMSVVAGGVNEPIARRLGIAENQIRPFPTLQDAFLAVQTGRVDAHATGRLFARIAAKSWPAHYELAVTEPLYEEENVNLSHHSAIAVHPDEKNFIDVFDERLVDFIGTERHLDMVEPYGITEANLPTKTRADLCAD